MTTAFLERGGLWVLIQFVLMIAVIWQGVGGRPDWTNILMIAVGVCLFLAGGAIGIAGVVVLDRNRTSFPKPRPGSRLITRGIYARMRHPLYTSVMLASLGWALIWQSMTAFVLALGLVLFFHAKARREERWLRATFPEYLAYERRVPRFLPARTRSHPPP